MSVMPLSRILLIAGVLFTQPALAQLQQQSSSTPEDTLSRAQQPRLTTGDSVRAHSAPTKSPGVALLLSAILPGAGQFYNESYIKVPIVLGFGVYFISSWLDYNRRYKEYRDRYAASLPVIPGGDDRLLNVREFYKDQRDTFTWYFIVLYLVNLADAYVDASLYGFDVGGDLSLRVLPDNPGGMSSGGRLQLSVRF